MELVIKAAGAAMVACVCIPLIKKRAPEHSLMLGAATAAILCTAALPVLRSVLEAWEALAGSAALSGAVLSPVAKCVGIGIITRLSSDFCRDSGSAGVSSAVELVGCVCALLAACPLMVMLAEMIGGFV